MKRVEKEAIFENWDFHHIGYATRHIEESLKHFLALGYKAEAELFEDHAQGIKGLFIIGGGPRVELLENLPDRTTLDPWLASGISMYHLAYEVLDISLATLSLKKKGAKVIVPPIESVAFNGRRISFIMMRNAMLVEIIEK